MKDKNIVLCGFMGCGKTTAGRIAAAISGRGFADTDAEAEKAAGKSISDIFAGDGEPVFREIERSVCAELAGKRGLVIATGGGAIADARNREVFTASGIIVFIDVPLEQIKERLASDHTRPLFKTADIDALFSRRYRIYTNAAHMRIDGCGSPDAVARRIINAADK